MKKLFTLLALLICFLGAKAVEIEDFTVDYTVKGASTIGWKAGMIQEEWITADADGLHLYNPEVTTNFYDYQLWIFDGAVLEKEMEYTIKIVAKVSDGSADVRCRVGGWGGGISGTITVNSTDYEEYTYSGVATETNNGLLVQFGDYVGTVSFKSVTITHEGKEQKPVNWINMLENGDASADWAIDGAQVVDGAYTPEGAEKVCAYSKEYGYNDNNPHAAFIEDGAFYTTTAIVDDQVTGDAVQWQNQFWINFPRALKEGEALKLSFRYKASEAASASAQGHGVPGAYMNNLTNFNFTEEWQEYSSDFVPGAGQQSLAFNLGVNGQDQKEITFYFDDLKLEYMDLEKGLFVAYTDTEDGTPEYDFDESISFEEVESDLFVATVGTVGDETSWVNQVMISTARGNDKGFKSATIKPNGAVKNDADVWLDYEEAGSTKINLPVKGVWQISVAVDTKQMNFIKLDGEPDKEKIDIVANPTEYTLHATARESQDWDNQFWIVADRVLEAGEETFIEFEYYIVSDVLEEAKVSTQVHAEPTDYRGGGIGDLTFTTQPQKVSQVFTIPKTDAGGVKSLAFNMACVPEACDYVIKNVIWKLNDDSESLISQTEGTFFYGKIGQGAAVQYPAEPKPASKAADPNINGDEAINGQDLQALINAIVDESTEIAKFDINGDGEINGQDIQALINIIVKQE